MKSTLKALEDHPPFVSEVVRFFQQQLETSQFQILPDDPLRSFVKDSEKGLGEISHDDEDTSQRNNKESSSNTGLQSVYNLDLHFILTIAIGFTSLFKSGHHREVQGVEIEEERNGLETTRRISDLIQYILMILSQL